MNDSNHTIPTRLQEIIEDFELCEGREKLQLLLQYSDDLPPVPPHLLDEDKDLSRIHECMTPVFLYVENKDGRLYFHLDVPLESPTVRGYAEVMRQGITGSTPEEVLAISGNFYMGMGLHRVLSSQRLMGITSILKYMKRMATRELNKI